MICGCIASRNLCPPNHSRCTGRVITKLTEPLRKKGYHTLRFNARGVGSSTGWSSLTGMLEGKDLEGLVQWALDQITNVQSLLLIVSPKSLFGRSLPICLKGVFTRRFDRVVASDPTEHQNVPYLAVIPSVAKGIDHNVQQQDLSKETGGSHTR